MWKYILCAFVSVTLARQMPFDNYKVYRVVPETESHLQVLRQLEEVALENGVIKSFVNFKTIKKSITINCF